MFELENNRGKDLTNMEKIKSYFMYQMYVYSPSEETESNIEHISNIFKLIYLTINDLKSLNEDSILIYHNNAYIKGYAYRTLDDLKDVFKHTSKADKIEWIKNYVYELYNTFLNMKKFEHSKNAHVSKLKTLHVPAFIYPFIIKGYKFFGEEELKMNVLFHLMEIVTFRARLINSRANIQERLNQILLDFHGDILDLNHKIQDKLNDSWYWSFRHMKQHLNGNMNGNKVLNYLLWQYENSLQMKGYTINKISIVNEQIEHISPQNPTNGDPIASGYEVNETSEYSEEFVNTQLNCIGNLMLISGSHNASIGNKPFSVKLDSYKQNPLLNQQAELKEFVENNIWNSEAIQKRHDRIISFCEREWNFTNVDLSLGEQ